MKTKKILFIEDDLYRNQPLVRYFEDIQKWKVVWATTPKDALAKLRVEMKDIDLILLDIMMPADESIDEDRSEMGMSTGLLLLDKIQGITSGKIPVVILSARQDLKYFEEGKDKKVAAVLQKPMSAEEIVKTIEKMS